MSLHLSKHERDRVKKGISGIRSFDIVDFPKLHKLEAGDMLMWDPDGQDGLGYWATSSQLFGKDIDANSTLIRDNSNNIAALDLKIDNTAIQVKNELINFAPETLDTLAEIAAVMGNPNNMAGTIINKLTLHDNIITNHSDKDTIHDVSINLLEQNVQKNFEDISQNRIDIVANNHTLANALQLTDIQVNNNITNIATNTTNVNTINIDVDQFRLDIGTNTQNILDISNSLFDPNIATGLGFQIGQNKARLDAVDISLNDTRVNNESRISDICNNLIRIVQNDDDIAQIQNRLDIAETDVATNKTNLQNHSTNLITNNGTLTDLQTRMANAETNITTNVNNITSNDNDIATNAANITALQNADFGGRLNALDISVNQLESASLNINSNLTKINQNTTDIATNLTNIDTNTTNIDTNTTNLATQTERLDTLMNGAPTALDTIKELADTLGDPNGIGSSVITKIGNLDASMNEIFNEKGSNDADIATNVANINANTVGLNGKQPLIGTDDLQISYTAGLIAALNAKQDAIEEEGLPQSKVSGLAVSLNSKQNVIPDGGLSIAKTANLQDKLNAKQDVIGEESLAQTKIFNLVASLASKQDNIGNGDLAISYTQGLQVALDNKQNVIQNNDLSIAQVQDLANQLAGKQLNLTAGSKITISNTQTIDTTAAVKLNELNDVKVGGSGLLIDDVEFENSMLLGTIQTGALSEAKNNIGIGNLALSSLSAGRNNIAIGVDSLKNLENKEYNVAIGTDTLRHVVGDGNTALGYKAGSLNLIAGENNTLIGRSADIVLGNTSITNATAIGYNSRVTSSNQIQLGNSLVTNVKTAGTMTLGEVTYPKLDGVAGQFLRTDGNGNATFTGITDFTDILNTLDTSMNIVEPAQKANTAQVEINKQAIEALVNADTTTLASINALNTALDEDFNFANTILGHINNRMSKNGDITENVTGIKTFVDGIVIPNGKILNGNSATTTKFKTDRFINGKLYNGAQNIDLVAEDLTNVTDAGSGKIMTDAERLKNQQIELYAEQAAQTYANIEAAGAVMANKNEVVQGIKTFTNGIAIPAGQELAGNSSTATKLKTARNINGTSFDGSSDININAIDLPDIASVGSGQIITIQERDDINTNKGRLNTLLNNANGVLDTVLEIQQAIATDPQFFQTMENSLATKMNKDGNVDEIITGIKTFANLLKATGGIEGDVTGNLTGNASTTTKFQTQRYINGHLFDGTTNATLNVVDLADVTLAGSGKIITDAERDVITNINTVIADKVDNQHLSNNGALMREGNQTVSSDIIFTGNLTGDLDGKASTATKLHNPRYIAGQLFDGSNDISISVTDLYDVIDKGSGKVITDDERELLVTTHENRLDQIDIKMNARTTLIDNQNNTIASIDGNTVKINAVNQTINGTKTFTNNIVGNITGNSNSATQLETARTIAGVLFDGRNNIEIPVENLSNVTDAGSGKIITDAERNNYNSNLNESVKLTNVDQTIDGVKTFTNPIIGSITGNAATATSLTGGSRINGQIFTGETDINLNAIDLADIDDIGSKRIITTVERGLLEATRNKADANEGFIQDISTNLQIFINNTPDVLETLGALDGYANFVTDVTNQVNGIDTSYQDLSSNHYALKAAHDTLQTQHTTLFGNHDSLYIAHDNLQVAHNTLKAGHDTLKADHDNLQTAHNTLSGNHDNLQTAHNTISGIYTTLQTAHNTLSSDHTTLQTAQTTLQTAHNTLQTAHNTLQTTLNTHLTTDFTLLSGNHDNLQIAHNTLSGNHTTLQTAHNTLQTSHNTLSGNHTALQTRVTNVEDSNEILENTTTAIDNKIIDISNNLYGDFTHTNSKTFTKTIIANGGITLDNKNYISGDRINYPNIVSATTYASADVQTNNDLATILTTLSNNIANLSSAINAIHNKTVLNE